MVAGEAADGAAGEFGVDICDEYICVTTGTGSVSDEGEHGGDDVGGGDQAEDAAKGEAGDGVVQQRHINAEEKSAQYQQHAWQDAEIETGLDTMRAFKARRSGAIDIVKSFNSH